MSDVFATDIYTKLATVSVLAASAGFALGGKAPDPAMTKIPLPAAWVLLGSDEATEPETVGLVARNQVLRVEYVVMIYVPYLSQTDLINTQFPLLRAARAAIHSTTAPNGNRWSYKKQKLALVNVDRLAYEQRYVVRVGV